MARRLSVVYYGVLGQSLTFRVPQGRPDSATFAVRRNYTTDEGAVEFQGAATVNTVNTTIGAASGQGQTDPRLVTLASSSNVASGSLYLISEAGLTELVEILSVPSGTTVRARFPLQNTYSTAATFAGVTLSAAVDATWISNLANVSDLSDTTPDYRVMWTIVVGGATVIAYSLFDVVRQDVRAHVDIGDVDARAFGLVDSLPLDYRPDRGRGLIDGAWRAVRSHMFASGISPEGWRDGEALDELVILRTLKHLGEGGWCPPGWDRAAWTKLQVDNYDNFFMQHVVGQKHKTEVEMLSTTSTTQMTQIEYWSK